jgi:phage repressor protein C with HTH and peptisase S24 domain
MARSMAFTAKVKHSFSRPSSIDCFRLPGKQMSIQSMLDRDPLTNEETAALIRAAIAAAPQTKAEIAERLDVSPQAITGWETTGRISKENLSGLAGILGKPIEHFIRRGSGAPKRDDWEDVLGYAQAVGLGNGVEAQEYAETHALKFKADSLARKGLFASNLAVMYGRGESMLPMIKEGDALLFDVSDKKPEHKAIFIVQLGKEIYAKRCLVLDDIVFFESINPDADHRWNKARRMDAKREPVQIIGRVRWLGSWVD